jgi:type IV fimbrial biogenesis protein FimT
MSAAVASLQADLRFARAEANRLRVAVQACPIEPGGACAEQAHWHTGWMVFADSNGDRDRSSGEPLLRSAPAIAGLNITSSSARRRLRFSPRGTAPGSNASITFCDDRGPEKARQLRLSASGRIRALDPPEAQVGEC